MQNSSLRRGRLYGTSAQVLPKSIREMTYGPAIEYDFQNCQPRLMIGLARLMYGSDQEARQKLPIISRLVDEREAVMDAEKKYLQDMVDRWRADPQERHTSSSANI